MKVNLNQFINIMTELKQTAIAFTVLVIITLLDIVAMNIFIKFQAELFILCLFLLIFDVGLFIKLVVEFIQNRLDL